MAKPTEKMLYQTFLDLFFADQDYDSIIENMSQTLKDLKANSKKTKKLLATVEQQYADLYGSKPSRPK